MVAHIQLLVLLAGLGQIVLALVSPVIPHILNWQSELRKVQPLIKQIFWVYACYILVINLCFGLVSAFCYTDLTNASTLARLLTGFIAAYWISRLSIQFFYFDRSNFPAGIWHRIGEVVLVSLFVFLTTVYCLAFYVNLTA
ncbi:hypothetical protein HQ865_13035 [Mucilaginibacter mali]|uniref:Uncharacterized protein n=1 Tax=Mucilaginibacter mali TaxID=2740462 RepID=A0A7D4QJ19_9SPHI|nr:hypothetical protein HQ865_13035 [Mucilaginibacter mali]